MISHIDSKSNVSRESLVKTCCGRKILSYLDAYGTDYDFCRFYGDENDSVMLMINSTLLISGDTFEKDELCEFVKMNQPFRIEGNQTAIDNIYGTDNYKKLHRTLFKLVPGDNSKIDENDVNFNPSLDNVYSILSEGFPNLLDYPLWLADTSHRIRHEISSTIVYKEITTASIVYDINGYVLVGQVATKISARGSGYARKLLRWLADYLAKQGKTSFLYALDTRESFYHEIGFEVYNNEYVLEKPDSKNESAVKGKLEKND
jgi:hypothetical protein